MVWVFADGAKAEEVRRMGGIFCTDGTEPKENLVRNIGVDERDCIVLAWVCIGIGQERGFWRFCAETLLSVRCSDTTGEEEGGRAVRAAAVVCERRLDGAAHGKLSELVGRVDCGNVIGSILCSVAFRPPFPKTCAATHRK